MSEFRPVDNIVDLCLIDAQAVEYGYIAGLNNIPEPVASIFPRGYWHGWRNGMVDGGYIEQDEYQERLAAAYCQPQWVH